MGWIETQSGIVLPTPAMGSGNTSISTLVDGGRNPNGKFVGSVIGDDKLKVECSWNALSAVEFQNLLKIFDRKQGGKFVQVFRVFDPRINDFRYVEMYVGDREGRPLMLDSNFRPKHWLDIKANLIEV